MESFGTGLWDSPGALFPEEARLMAAAGAKRRQEFTAVRECARRALRSLGEPQVPLLPGPRGAPEWPPGIVGAMTHCNGYQAAAVARVDHGLVSVGIDAEPHAELPPYVRELVVGNREAEQLRELAGRWPSVHWGRVLFSAKETVFKAWYPLARSELDFLQAEVSLWPDSEDGRKGGFRADLLRPGPVVEISGKWGVTCETIATAAAIDTITGDGPALPEPALPTSTLN
ncbi:4'-phosphopantetheinyl transferase family protein [Streptomyces sp. YJ-C3]